MILFGEHASSRGYPAIVFAINKRLKAELSENNEENEIRLSSKLFHVQNEIYPTQKLSLVSHTITKFFEKTSQKKESFKINVTSDIPVGFGSSAAVIVSTLGALDKFYNTNLSLEELMTLGIEINFSHKGYGSGLDIAAAVFGGLIKYQMNTIPEKLPYEKLTFVIGSTGIKADSKPLVENVKELEKNKPDRTKQIFFAINEIVEEAIIAIQSHDLPKIGELMNKNQLFLRELGVSTPLLDELIAIAIKNGALGAKISGAGGGDNMIALIKNSNKKRVQLALYKSAEKVLDDITISPDGLLYE